MGKKVAKCKQGDVRSNWIEQIVNACGGLCLLAAVLLA